MPAKLSLPKLNDALGSLRGWSYDGSGAITKTFKFKDHITAMGFVTRAAMVAEVMDHHPDLRIVYSTVDVALSTHSAGGVTRLDLELAARLDSLR
ncbi:MAG: 4a-hydroxytetrahydrobiopterin dehydratase [Dehalococcoidia bacterium]